MNERASPIQHEFTHGAINTLPIDAQTIALIEPTSGTKPAGMTNKQLLCHSLQQQGRALISSDNIKERTLNTRYNLNVMNASLDNFNNKI
jgi:hypothetical protein